MPMRRAVRKILRLVVSAGLLAWLAWRTPWGQLGQAFAHLRLHWTSRFDRARQLAAGAMVYLRHLPLIAGTAGLSVVVQAVNVIVVWLIGRAINAPVPGVYWWIVVPMVTLLTLLPVSVSGMG